MCLCFRTDQSPIRKSHFRATFEILWVKPKNWLKWFFVVFLVYGNFKTPTRKEKTARFDRIFVPQNDTKNVPRFSTETRNDFLPNVVPAVRGDDLRRPSAPRIAKIAQNIRNCRLKRHIVIKTAQIVQKFVTTRKLQIRKFFLNAFNSHWNSKPLF